MTQKKKKILFVTGSRGEWGYIRPILRLIQSSEKLDYSICATNMQLLPAFGTPAKEIEADGFKIDHKIYMALDGYNHIAMMKSLGIFLSSLADVIASDPPDWILLAGDRGEMLAGAVAGAFCYIPVAHIQAGEVSGNIDGMTRHAIGKFAHLHLAANQDAADRLVKLGEEPFRVHNVGAPQLDELVDSKETDLAKLNEVLQIDLNRPFLLLVQHAATEEAHLAESQIQETMTAMSQIDMPKVVILPNNDAGSQQIRNGIESLRKGEFYCYSNLKREDYLGLLKNAEAIIGNSSSGLLEAPTYKTAAVNIGRRQEGRVRGINVIDTHFKSEAILEATQKAIGKDFQNMLENKCVNPYGDGKSSERIIRLLEEIPLNNELLVKKLTY